MGQKRNDVRMLYCGIDWEKINQSSVL